MEEGKARLYLVVLDGVGCPDRPILSQKQVAQRGASEYYSHVNGHEREGALKREYSIAEARNQLARIVHQAERGSPIKLTRRGKPVAILLATREYEDLTRGTPSFREAFEKFSRNVDLRDLDLDPGFFQKLRDPSPGRKVKF